MTIRDDVRGHIKTRLTRSRLTGLLGWDIQQTDPDDLTDILDDAFRLVPEIASNSVAIDATSQTKAFAAGRVSLWRAIREGLVLAYDFRADNESYSRSQILSQIDKLLQEAEQDARSVGVDLHDMPPIKIGQARHETPYREDRPLVFHERLYRKTRES
jgi:hypothetical protein